MVLPPRRVILSSLFVPFYGFRDIGRYTESIFITVAKTILSFCIILFRCFTIPLYSFLIILGYTIASIIAIPQIILPPIETVFGRFLYHFTAS